MTFTSLRLCTVSLLLAGLTGGAAAHTGHDADSLFAGLAHPFAVDHLLVMVAIGVWSALALQGARRWLGPLTFLSLMALGAALAVRGFAMPALEHAIAISVVLCGALLAFAKHVPAAPGLLAVAAIALMHGLAHGAELPTGATASAYAGGFLAATAWLHLGGLGLGLALNAAAPKLWPTLGALLGVAGMTLLMRA
jgi:urease accessory protein